MESGSSEDPRLAAFIARLDPNTPEEIQEPIVAGLKRRFVSDKTEDFEFVLRRAIPPDRLRDLLFAPSNDDMALYPSLLAASPEELATDAPAKRVQTSASIVLYLVHSRDWDRMRPFIEAGGLRACADMLRHPSAQLQGQALEILLNATASERYDWFADPPGLERGSPLKGPDGDLWGRMLELSRTSFVGTLLSFRSRPFPGAGLSALRLFAFYASWVRRWFCPGGVLRMSPEILERLRLWATDEEAEEAERVLAKQLHEDFSRFPLTDPGGPNAVSGDGTIATEEGEALEGLRVVLDRTSINGGPGEGALGFKERGNACFREGRWTEAIEWYSKAIDCPVPVEEIVREGPRRAGYHANRAAAYLQRAAAYAEGRLAPAVDALGHLEGREVSGSAESLALQHQAAVLDCDSTLELEPRHCKAWHRKATALVRLGRTAEARAAAEEAERAAGGDAGLRREAARLLAKIARAETGSRKETNDDGCSNGKGDEVVIASDCKHGGEWLLREVRTKRYAS